MSASRSKTRRYIPTWQGEIEGWTVNHLTEHVWRVAGSMERSDCLQEAQCVFIRVAERYPEVNDPRHFMALYKTAWVNQFADFCRAERKVREHEVHVPIMDRTGDTCNEGELRVKMRQAPREVRMVLNLLFNAPQEILDIVMSGWNDKRSRTGVSKASAERLNAMLGLPVEMNTLERVREYFQP